MSQRCVIPDWLPPAVLNGSRQKHWSTLRKQALQTRTMVWASCKHAGWTRVDGKVRLTVLFVFPVKRRRDTDNTVARAKHLVDGIKGVFFEDDDTEHLELVVRAETRPGQKRTELLLEAAS